MKRTIMLLLAVIISIAVQGQSGGRGCKVSALNISTGYDNGSGKITDGAPDPHWYVYSLSPDLAALYPSITSFPYPAVGAGCEIATSYPTYRWISFDLNCAYDTRNHEKYYSMILRRDFTTCEEDDYTFDLHMSWDNWINTFTIYGITIYSETPNDTHANWTTLNPMVCPFIHMMPGSHYIEIEVVNYPDGISNPHGLMLQGTMTSYSGRSTILANDPGCTCE